MNSSNRKKYIFLSNTPIEAKYGDKHYEILQCVACVYLLTSISIVLVHHGHIWGKVV